MTALRDLMLDDLEVSKALVIAPLRVARDTWPAEVLKWDHLHELDISVIVGDTKQRVAAVNHGALIYVINRENVKWLVNYYESNGMRWPFDMVVIDELSSFKNHQSQRFRWLRKVRPFVRRWVGLTGTPASNGLMDLWAEIGILDGGERLGKFIGRYREAYFTAASLNPQTGVVFQYRPKPGAEEQIYNRISDITISMKALDYLHMPDIVYASHPVSMDEKEKKLYEQLRDDLIIPLEDEDIDAANAASLSNKLLQMANGAVYDENKNPRLIHDRKLDMLEDLIEAANGQPVLIAYWFKHDRMRILERLASLGYCVPGSSVSAVSAGDAVSVGSSSAVSARTTGGSGSARTTGGGEAEVRDLKESQDIQDWNRGSIPIALIHPASAGHGLNIQDGGHILIWFGLTWSLELYQQTNARLWRQGQREVVTVHHIITKDTVDEDVLAALSNKDVTQEKLIAAVRARLR